MNRSIMLLALFAFLGCTAAEVEEDPVPDDPVIAVAKGLVEAAQGVPALEIGVVRVSAAEWRDSSLGCPQKGMVYQPVMTPGHVVVLEAKGSTYTVHVAGSSGIICSPRP